MAAEPAFDFSRVHPWWGQVAIPGNMQVRWQLGPLTVWLQRLPNEMRLAWRNEEKAMAYEVAAVGAPEDLADDLHMERYGFSQDLDQVHVVPALPDRPVVSTPEKPLHVFAGEQVVLYLTFPLWLRIEAGTPPRRLLDLPTLRLSDTWFGPPTQEGGLCYASHNFGRLALDEVRPRPHRALTAVHLRNHAAEPLCVERIHVPLPHLSLYQDRAGVIWTENLILERHEVQAPLVALLGHGPPPEAEDAQRVVPPRQAQKRHPLARALGGLISAS